MSDATLTAAFGAEGIRRSRLEKVEQLGNVASHQLVVGSAARTRARIDTTPIYYAPESFSREQQMAAFAVFVLMGKSSDEDSQHWQSYFISVVCSAFPELLSRMMTDTRMTSYTFRPISETMVDDWVSQISRLYDDEAQEPAAGVMIIGPPELPDMGGLLMDTQLVSACSSEAFYAYWSLMLFYSCKSINADNRDYVSTRRPKALIDKRGLQANAAILNGEHRFPTRNIPLIKTALARSTLPRIHIFEHHANLAASPDLPENLEVVQVTMTLLKDINMTYINHIADLLTTCPWVVLIDELWNSFQKYKEMVTHLRSINPLTRPYYKVMYLDRAALVYRKPIEPMIACATLHVYQTRRSMNQYRISEDSMPVVDKFIRLAATYGYELVVPETQQKTEQAI